MYKIKFSKFMNGRYPENWDYSTELYIIRNSKKVLYIGISRQGIWNRWFGNCRSHIFRNGYGEYLPNSHIAKLILNSMPNSNDWTIEFWTRRDCAAIIGIEDKPYDEMLEYYEEELIMLLQPTENTLNANYHKRIDAKIYPDELREAHREIFD